jgi:surfeit locus 1 family protein
MKRWALLILAVLGTVGFGALGVWQEERREWKLALIERVEQRIHATPVAAPGPSRWPALNRENAEYLRVTAAGQFLEGHDTLVQALTARGAGYWVLTPLQTDEGFVVLVNRGFVGQSEAKGLRARGSRNDADPPAGHVSVTGLLRLTEPSGGFLRANVPAQDQWYSRDVQAIAQARTLSGVAPYFIDAEASDDSDAAAKASVNQGASAGTAAPQSAGAGAAIATASQSPGQPVAGLTVVSFRNSHLSYALTWFALALMSAFFGLKLLGVGPFGAKNARARPNVR